MATRFLETSDQCQMDCQALYLYFHGNEETEAQRLVDILANRTTNGLKIIRQNYIDLYGHNLLHFLQNIQCGNLLARIAYLRISEPQERDAEILRHSMFGGYVDLSTVIETTCTCTSSELHGIMQAYRSLYNSDLEQDMAMKINGGYKEILLAILRSCCKYGKKVDTSASMCDAKTLYEAIESEKTIDQMTIIKLLSQRNTAQMNAILVSYKQLYGHNFSKSLKRSKCGQFGQDLRIVIRAIQYPEKFLAKQLRMRKADSHEILIRIIITRSNIDIKMINKTFSAKTGRSLENIVRREFSSNKDKTNGIVSSLLVALINGC